LVGTAMLRCDSGKLGVFSAASVLCALVPEVLASGFISMTYIDMPAKFKFKK